ncbi:MAG TPA: hypothetical protein VMV94_14585 [Phycisphaerae bacterium]|nr:hypothetical protein [Phycisphaerae bacterium]
MSSSTPLRPKSYSGLTIFVCTASTLIAAFMGLLAMVPYVLPHEGERDLLPLLPVAGIGGGAASGLLAGIFWCRVMIRPAMLDRRGLVGLGASVGIAVGSLATVLLHACLMIYVWAATDAWHLDGLVVGLIFGIPSGAVLGAICGYVLRCKADAANVGAATIRMRSDAPHDSSDAPT